MQHLHYAREQVIYGKYCSTEKGKKRGKHHRPNVVCAYFHVEGLVPTLGSCSIPTRKVDIEGEGSTPFSPKDIVDTATTKLALVLCETLALVATSLFLIDITSLTLSLGVR